VESQHAPEQQEVRCEQCGAVLKQEEEASPEEQVHYYLLKYYE
jgi:uncharacterized protein with PIN domain